MNEKKPPIDPAVKSLLITIMGESVLELLTDVARFPGKSMIFYENNSGIRDSDVRSDMKKLIEMDLIEKEKNHYQLEKFTQKYKGDLLKRLYPACRKCSHDSLLGARDALYSYCNHKDHETGNDGVVQMTGCIDFDENIVIENRNGEFVYNLKEMGFKEFRL